jgi:hypothetical protein
VREAPWRHSGDIGGNKKFTAEASLYKTGGNYRIKGAHYGVDGFVYPAVHWAIPFAVGLPITIADYLFTRFCCRDCANDCRANCFGPKLC